MAVDNMLFHVDAVIIDGKPLAFEDGTGMLSGAARFQNEVVTSATGDDFNKRKRVPTYFKCKLQFGPTINPADFKALNGVQISARDTQSGRRVLMPKCSFGEIGEIGGGSVDITFNVLAELQWL